MAPMGNINMADPIGRPLAKMIDYFVERAKGGTGLLITGLIPVSLQDRPDGFRRIMILLISRGLTDPPGHDWLVGVT